MKFMPNWKCSIPSITSLMVALVCALPGVRGGQLMSSSLPPGIVDFAGRAAHSDWYLFGKDARATLDGINRELRQASHDLERSRDEQSRAAASNRGIGAVRRLRDLTARCPDLIRVNLNAAIPELSPSGPYELPGESGALLFEVTAGGEGLDFQTVLMDLELSPDNSNVASVNVADSGTTFVLLDFEHLPTGRNMFGVRFEKMGKSSVRFSLEMKTPEPGRLKLTVLSDDTGKPCPAMVQLLWRTNDVVWKPDNAIDFAPQFDRLGRNQLGKVSGARYANLPGLGDAPFWCVPGPVDMALAPGKWRIGVRRGTEHGVVFEDVTIHSGKTVERTLRPKRWVDMRRLGWWSGDDHVHCRIMSAEDARHLIDWVEAEDVHLANIAKMGDIRRTYFEQRGFGPAFRVTDGDYVLCPGQECPRTNDQLGHVLAMNITSMVRNTERYLLYDEVFDKVHAQGGLTGYAHVSSGMFHVNRDMSMNVPQQKVDFAEILQFNTLGTDLYYDFLNLGCKLTAAAGSDVPWGGTIGEVRVYAYLAAQKFSADAWFDAFRRGHTFSTSGPMVEFSVDDALPGDEIRVESDRKLHVHARAWGDPERMSPVKLEIVQQGVVIQTTESRNPQRAEAEVDLDVSAGNGFWIAARARGGDGTSAHTTPVYVVRSGLRFWKFDGLDKLIDKQLASLDEIDRVVEEARAWAGKNNLGNGGRQEKNGEQRATSGGALGGDVARDSLQAQLALQSDLLLERVSQARELYANLRRIEAAERSVRETDEPPRR